jgi:hypothetical protein
MQAGSCKNLAIGALKAGSFPRRLRFKGQIEGSEQTDDNEQRSLGVRQKGIIYGSTMAKHAEPSGYGHPAIPSVAAAGERQPGRQGPGVFSQANRGRRLLVDLV